MGSEERGLELRLWVTLLSVLPVPCLTLDETL